MTTDDREVWDSMTMGIFNPMTFGLTLKNFQDIESDIETEMAKITEVARNNRARADELLLEHQRKYNLYYRVRAHEKAHWYTTISSSIMASRLLSDGDCTQYLRTEIDNHISKTEDDLCLPLGTWAQSPNCPKEMSDAVHNYKVIKYLYAAIDGILLPGHLLGSDHLLSIYFPDLVPLGNYWEKPSYKLGIRALVEGAGKAAEWLYYLRKDRSLENEAWQDLQSSPVIYRMAFDRLYNVIRLDSLSDYLQLLVVVVDFALNPWISYDSWPYFWGNVRGVDVIPGFRFEKIIELLRQYPDIDTSSKEKIFNFLTDLTVKEYQWKSPQEVNTQLQRLLSECYCPANLDKSPGELWNPLITMQKVLEVKQVDPLAYIPPVNAPLINSTDTYPQILLTSNFKYAPDDQFLIVHIMRSMQEAFTYDLMNAGTLKCPFTNDEWVFDMLKYNGLCRSGERCPAFNVSAPRSWLSNPSCGLYKSLMQGFFKDNVGRIRLITPLQRGPPRAPGDGAHR